MPGARPIERVAFLCLGTMGGPMAGHLVRAGFEVTVYNRTRARAEAWAEKFSEEAVAVRVVGSPREAAAGADAVLACTGADPDLEQIVLGPEGALAAMEPGSFFIDHTTASADLARRLAGRCEGQGVSFLDAPVSGGEAGAQSGQLTIMVGGDEQTYRRAAPLFDCYAKKHLLLGPAGSGQLTKMVNQICIAGLVEALSEGLLFAEAAGLDRERVVEVISEGAAGSWQMANRAQTMLAGQYDFGFAVDWMRKDLAMALEEASRRGVPLPVTEIVDGLYAEVQRLGGGRLDTSSLLLGLEDRRRRS